LLSQFQPTSRFQSASRLVSLVLLSRLLIHPANGTQKRCFVSFRAFIQETTQLLPPSDNYCHQRIIIMTPSFLLLSSCTLLVLSSSIPFALAQDPVPLGLGQLVWSEEFDYTGSLKSEHWDYDIQWQLGMGQW
jgi:hypothetical protein